MMRALFAALAVLAMSSGAAAEDDPDSFYIEARGGVSLVPDTELRDTTGELDSIGLSDLEAQVETGFVVEGAFGYTYAGVVRGEISIGYRRNSLDGLSATSPGGPVTADVEGDVSIVTALVNVYSDVRLAYDVVSFVGAGIGPAVVLFEVDGETDADTVFAWQLTGGLAYPLTSDVTATLRYVYLETTDPAFEGLDANYHSHNVMLGLRYRF